MLSVRERPPLRVGIRARSPSGREHRWAADERNPINAPQGLRWSSTIPGGFENADCKLVRKPGIDYSDLDRLTTLRIEGAGGRCAGEYRLERTPRVSGDQMAISPSAVGWQAALDDNKAAREIYVDIDLSHWGSASVARKLANIPAGYGPLDPSVRPDRGGLPSLDEQATGSWSATGKPAVEAWYDAGPSALIGAVYYGWQKSSTVSSTDANWVWQTWLSTDDILSSSDVSGNLRAAGPGSGSLSATASRRFAMAQMLYNAAVSSADGVNFDVFWTLLAVVGNHGLTLYGTTDNVTGPGVLASDVCAHAVGKYAPPIVVDPANIDASLYAIPHLAFWDSAVSAGEIVKQATRFELYDWAVWNGPRIAQPAWHYHARNTYGRKWRARIGPAGLEETGPQVDRLWNNVVVEYQDVAGVKRTVGPPGSGADTEDASLTDTDPLNPANEVGLNRCNLEQMGTSTASGAIKIGSTFLYQSKLLDTSGRATLKGWVVDDRGVMHPYWAVRAGDTISFVDAADTSERRIVKVDCDDSTRVATIDLDSPPEGLQSLLERLSVAIVGLGLT